MDIGQPKRIIEVEKEPRPMVPIQVPVKEPERAPVRVSHRG